MVGSTFMVEGQPFTIAGIAPPGFFGETLRSDPPDVWLPLQQEPLIRGQGSFLRQPVSAWLRVIGRLKPGATIDGMSPRLTEILRQWIQHDSGYPAAWMGEIVKMLPKQSITVVPAGAGVGVMKEEYGRSLQILMCVCGLVLLIACANLANLLLARSMARRTQTSVRIAIGASRSRIVRQALTESVLLALAGGLAGLIVAVGAQRLLLAIAFHTSTFMPIDTTPSLSVLGFALGLSLLTAYPLRHRSRLGGHPVGSCRGAARRKPQHHRPLFHDPETAAGVPGYGVRRPGCRSEHVGTQPQQYRKPGFRIRDEEPDHGGAEFSSGHLRAGAPRRTLSRLGREAEPIAGVERSGLALYNPFTDNWGELIFVAGRAANTAISENSTSSWDRVTASYLQAVGQPILRGRGLTEADRGKTAQVAVVNEAFVRRFFPNEDPVGKHFGLDLPDYADTFEIVGIVRDAKYIQPEKPARPMFFVPLAQWVGSYKEELLQKVDRALAFHQQRDASDVRRARKSGAGAPKGLRRSGS